MTKKETRKDALLRLIWELGGEAVREKINQEIPKYWELSEKDREIEPGVSKPRYWHTSASICQALKDRDGYLENPSRGIWRITEKGKEYLPSKGLSQSGPDTHTGDELPLCEELRESQRKSKEPATFEEVLMKAFRQLGFSAEHIGGADEPDVLIRNYGIIIEAKTTKQGTVGENQVNFNALKRYKQKYGSKHVGVVAPGFPSGNIQNTAAIENITLIETEVICELLRNHAVFPYQPSAIIDVLFGSGKNIITPRDVPPSTIGQKELIEVTAKILSDIKSTGKTSFSPGELHTAYQWQRPSYGLDDIEGALKFLSTPPLRVLQKRDNEYSLTDNIESILKKIGLLLEAFKQMQRTT